MRARVERAALIAAVESAEAGELHVEARDGRLRIGEAGEREVAAAVEILGSFSVATVPFLGGLRELTDEPQLVLEAHDGRVSLTNDSGQVRALAGRVEKYEPPPPQQVEAPPRPPRSIEGDRLYVQRSVLLLPLVVLPLYALVQIGVRYDLWAIGFGVGAGLLLLAVLSVATQIVFDAEGLRFVHVLPVGLRRPIRWNEVDRFFVDEVWGRKFVAYRLVRPRRLRWSSRRDGTLPQQLTDTRGGIPLGAQGVCDVLETLRARYGGAPRG